MIDVVESVRLMDAEESLYIDRWLRFIDAVQANVLPKHQGRIVKSLGDGLLLEFGSVPQALAAAFEIQRQMARINDSADPNQVVRLRFGAHVADVVVDALDIYGRGVNVAARLTTVAEPGDLVASNEFLEALLPGHDADVDDLGDCWFKHMDGPVRAFRLAPRSATAPFTHTAPPVDMRPTVAVIPFLPRQHGADPYLGEVLADEVIGVLSRMSQLQVLSRLTTTAVAGRALTAVELASMLKAEFIVSGGFYTDGHKLTVHVEVCSGRDGNVIHTQRVAGSTAALVADGSPMAAELVEQLVAIMLHRELELARFSPLPNLPGYTLLLGGITLMHRFSPHDFKRAHELLATLAQRWPRLASPHAWLARWHMFSVMQGWSSDAGADQRKALDESERALALEPDSSVALTMAGSVRIGLYKDIDKGSALYRQALDANPNDSLAWMLLGTAHAFQGQGTPAQAASAQAIHLSPLDPLRFMYDCHAAGTAVAAGDYVRARDLALASNRSNGLHLSTHRVLAIAHQLLGEHDQARAVVARLVALDPRQSVERYLATTPSADFPIGRLCARALAEAGLPQQGRSE